MATNRVKPQKFIHTLQKRGWIKLLVLWIIWIFNEIEQVKKLRVFNWKKGRLYAIKKIYNRNIRNRNCVKRNVVGNFMNDTLNDFKVKDRQTFNKFLELLLKDHLGNPESWKNKTLPDFLEAFSAYTEDIQGYYDNLKLNKKADMPDWSTFADIFKGAKIYE